MKYASLPKSDYRYKHNKGMGTNLHKRAPKGVSGKVSREMVKRAAEELDICRICLGEGDIADGLDEAACSYPCPECFGSGYDVVGFIKALGLEVEEDK